MEAPKFSEQTKARIAKNIEVLKVQNVPYYAEMKNIPTELNTKLKDKEQIFKLLISKFLVATMSATFPQEVDLQFFDFIQRNMDIQYKLDNILSDEDKEVLNKIRNNESINKDKLTWLYEECAIYLWVLGLWEFPNSNHECNTKAMNDMLFITVGESSNNPSVLYEYLYDAETKSLDLNKLNMKTYEEILEKADLISRYKWAIEEEYVQKTSFNMPLNRNIVYSQLNAFFEILL